MTYSWCLKIWISLSCVFVLIDYHRISFLCDVVSLPPHAPLGESVTYWPVVVISHIPRYSNWESNYYYCIPVFARAYMHWLKNLPHLYCWHFQVFVCFLINHSVWFWCYSTVLKCPLCPKAIHWVWKVQGGQCVTVILLSI